MDETTQIPAQAVAGAGATNALYVLAALLFVLFILWAINKLEWLTGKEFTFHKWMDEINDDKATLPKAIVILGVLHFMAVIGAAIIAI